MADMKYLSVEEFTALTASDAPAPGGGSVSALVAGLGAALAEMVANLTIGKENMPMLMPKCEPLHSRQLLCVKN